MIISSEEACARLQDEFVVAVPTETVYGLAGRYDSIAACETIYSIKNRPRDNPLIVHIGSIEQLPLLTHCVTETHKKLIDAFWPGPLTLLFDALDSLPKTVTAQQKMVAIRMPNHPTFLEILKKTGPLVAPSANLSGRPSPTRPSHIEHDFGALFPVLDGGQCVCGLESTILSIGSSESCHILREGSVPRGEIEKIVPVKESPISCVVPGAKYKHYAPKTPLFPLGNTPVECVIGFKERRYRAQHVFVLGDSTEPEEVAKSLYSILRALDHCQFGKAYVDMDFPTEGLFSTIYERLSRALSCQ